MLWQRWETRRPLAPISQVFGLLTRPRGTSCGCSIGLAGHRAESQPTGGSTICHSVVVGRKATFEALDADGRLADCVLLVIGGQLIPEPGGTINSWSVAAMAWVLRTFVARKAWR